MRRHTSVRVLSRTFALLALLGSGHAYATDANQPPKAVSRTIGDITTLLDQYKPDPRQAESIRRILDQLAPEIQDTRDLALFYKSKANAAQEVGAAGAFVQAMRKVVELGGELDPIEDLHLLAHAEGMAGNLQQAVDARKRVLASIPPGKYEGKRLHAFGNLALIHARLGELDLAEQALVAAEKEYKSGLLRPHAAYNRHAWIFGLDRYKASVLLNKGKPLEAEALLLHAAAEMPRVISDVEMARVKRDGSTRITDGTLAYMALRNQTDLAEAVAQQGRLTEAELLVRNALIDGIRSFGRYSFYTGSLVSPYVRILVEQGRYVEAEQLARAGIDIYRHVGTPDDSASVYALRSDLGVILVAQGRYVQALTEFNAMRDALASLPVLQSKLARGNLYWALALIERGDAAEARAMLDGLLEASRLWLGAGHADSAILQAARGMAFARTGRREAALKDFRGAFPALISVALSQGDEPSQLKTQVLGKLLEAYLLLLGEVHATSVEQRAKIETAGEAFRIADLLRGQSTQQAVVAAATRAAATDPLIGKEIRKGQDLQQEISALYRILRDLMTAPPDSQRPKVMVDMQRRIEDIRKEQQKLEADIARRFPGFANLMRPQPPSLDEARAALRPNEALINIFSAASATYVWALRGSGPMVFAVVPLSRGRVNSMVATLRKALDPGEVDIERRLPRYDVEIAYQLYAALLEAVSAGWEGADSLLVTTNGSLGQLPFGALPTAKVALPASSTPSDLRYAEYAGVPWLIKKVAVTQLPTVNVLVVLRRLPAASAHREPFIGFGDPLFGGVPVAANSPRRLRNLSIERPGVPGAWAQANGIATGAAKVRSFDWINYSAIPPLPDTREEILSLASTLKANPEKDVFLGAEASRANVKKLDLSKKRIVAFATHGLLPNDFPGVDEPSLALANPNDGTHGLLTLGDILRLKLDADWVVLSACNTAAGDGSGADAISGLGRGFFYAGSRALLVTHWPVESVSARLLVTGLFERQARDTGLSRTEALRQSMLSLMQRSVSSFSYAHPLFWAPYALVGDGGR